MLLIELIQHLLLLVLSALLPDLEFFTEVDLVVATDLLGFHW